MNTEKWKIEFLDLSKRIKETGSKEASDRIRVMRTAIFKETTVFVNNGFYTSTKAGLHISFPDDTTMRVKSKLYSAPIFLPSSHERYETQIQVLNMDCLLTAEFLIKQGFHPVVLNMANRQTPGGGVYKGAGAQEENLFRRTNLFRSLYQYSNFAKLYGLSKSQYQYPLDKNYGGIYTPDVFVFRGLENEGYPLLDQPFLVSVVSVAAMNRPRLDGDNKISENLIPGVKNKMRTILRIGIKHNHDAIILGAFGCGAFRNPPSHIARLFHEVFEEEEFKNRYKLISFAIIDDHNTGKMFNSKGNYLPFKEEFE